MVSIWRAPRSRLTVVKALVPAGKVGATHSAKEGATALGLELSDMLAVAMALARLTSTRA